VVTEATNAAGIAVTPVFDANGSAGAFTATATVSGSTRAVSFALDNLAGRPSSLHELGAGRRAQAVGKRYSRPLEVRLVDGGGKPVAGQTVTFTLGSGGASAASAGAAASFVGGAAEATVTTDSAGIAISPPFDANTTAGTFTATATAAGVTRAASFPLRNLAGKPATITAGAAASEQAVEGARFPIPLAVTVTDEDGNAVAGAAVRFSAPERGPSGAFVRRGRPRAVVVRTDASGVAVAPGFVANQKAGGYVVRAAVGRAPATAFALVNQPPDQA
jgi:hypothetical protein